jgi:elongator complex protein 1
MVSHSSRGDQLCDVTNPKISAAFVLGERLDRAMVAYEQAHAWRQLFALAISEKIEAEELNDMCERVSGELNGILAASIDWVSLRNVSFT